MCIFSVIYRVVPECPIFVLTNRDESTERPSVPPQVFPSTANGPRWFGAADARAGGTWFGINEHGLLAAVTNRKKTRSRPIRGRADCCAAMFLRRRRRRAPSSG